MTRLTDPLSPPATGSPLAGVPVAEDRSAAKIVRDGLSGKQVCPFCGSQNAITPSANGTSTGPCPRCTMEDTAATRQATKARIGPWHVMQTRNPAAPGMRYATLLALVGKGQVTARSVVRGPTTHQLWRYAAHVKGLSREFGVCYSCGESVDKAGTNCPHCDRAQEPAGNPDALLETREPTAVNANPLSTATAIPITDQPAIADAYSLAARQSALVSPALPMVSSHADRLRSAAEGRLDTRRRPPDGRALSAMELAAALQVAPPPVSMQQGRPVRTVLITLIVVAVLASLIIGYARPDLRTQALNWLSVQSTKAEQKFSNFHLQKAPPSDRPTDGTGDGTSPRAAVNGDGNQTVPGDVSSPVPGDVSSPVVSPAPIVPNQSAPNQITPSLTAPAQFSPSPIAIPEPAPTQNATPSGAQTPSAPTAVQPPPDQNTPAPAPRASILPPDRPVLVGGTPSTSDIWVLHSRGLDAESRQDWTEAVRCYEQIEMAPKDQWPSDVKIRLDIARRQLGK